MDFAQFSDDELQALKKGDYSKLSDKSLMLLKQGSAPQQPQQPGIPEMAAQASNPGEMLKTAAPSNLLKMAGVAAANAPGLASLAVNSLPGIGNPGAIPQAVANIVQNPQQATQAASRAIQTQGGAQMTPAEQTQANMGQVAGSAMEMALPAGEAATAAKAAAENKAETAAAQATMQEVPAPGVKVVQTPPPQKTLALPEPTPRSPEIEKASGDAAKKLNDALNFLTDKAKAKYKLAQKVFGVDGQQVDLAVRKPDELKAAMDEVMAAKKPGVKSVGSDMWTGLDKTEQIPAMPRAERLQKLWQIDKELSQNINYNDPASQQGIFALQKQVRAEMETLPGGKKLAEMRKEYSNMKALQDELGPALQDPAKQRVILSKIAQGEMKGNVTEANAARAAAIDKLEKATGSDVLSSVKNEYQQKALYDQALSRKADAEKLFQNEQRKEAFKQAMDQKNGEKALAILKREQDAHDISDAKLIARMAAENPAAMTGKQKMINALKYLAKATAVGAIGGVAAKAGFHLMGE